MSEEVHKASHGLKQSSSVDKRKASLYSRCMIKSFRHKGLDAFFRTGSKSGIQPHHAAKLRLILTLLNRARGPADLSGPGLFLHGLGGQQAGLLSVRVNGNWRVVFRFDGIDVELVDYLDYH